ncbi:Potassium efflux system KefA protein / Small-conductance mechanosensitive channel [Enhygromyxa salina]|uniref:Potassium efflux system KefA protein / Small-conductance mechanosensitive channel n=2 Tax=Enhygromyxa salina TaxID=215803 RepID=A0A0C2DFF3_9BACT|nr:Potassium efflux system KefA protein / Small-conductance mechanosensitive channel [Enhygromyxa salina]
MLPNFLLAAVVVALFGLLARHVGNWTRRGFDRVTNNEALSALLGSVAKVGVVIAGISVALSLLHLDKAVTSLLAGVGVIGLALGFAFQDIAANFMAGAMLAFRGSFEPGDIIEIGDKIGTVEETHLRRTVMRTFDGLHVIVPNKDLSQNVITNYSRTKERRVDIELGVAYADDLERAREVVIEALEEVEWRDRDRDIEVFFKSFGSSSIDFDVRVWLGDPAQFGYLEARSDMIIRIKRAIDEAGLSIPFPIRTLDFGAQQVGGASIDASTLHVQNAANASEPG